MSNTSNRIYMSNKAFEAGQHSTCPEFKGAFLASAPTLIAESVDAFEMKIKVPEGHRETFNVQLEDREINIDILSPENPGVEKKIQLYYNRDMLKIPKGINKDRVKVVYTHGILKLTIPKQ